MKRTQLLKRERTLGISRLLAIHLSTRLAAISRTNGSPLPSLTSCSRKFKGMNSSRWRLYVVRSVAYARSVFSRAASMANSSGRRAALSALAMIRCFSRKAISAPSVRCRRKRNTAGSPVTRKRCRTGPEPSRSLRKNSGIRAPN